MKRAMLVAAVAFVALTGVACGGGGDDGTADQGGTAVTATLSDFSIALGPSQAPGGTVRFEITNEGPSVHEFVIFRTDLAPDALPTTGEGVVDEAGEGLELVDEVEDIAAGQTATLETDLEGGSYAVVCNIPGHYAAGMHAPFTVV